MHCTLLIAELYTIVEIHMIVVLNEVKNLDRLILHKKSRSFGFASG